MSFTPCVLPVCTHQRWVIEDGVRLYLIALVLVILGIVGGVFTGGIFTIVVVPLAAIALLSGLGYSLLARATDPHPHQPMRVPRHVPSSPERRTDERRVRQ
jgi:hypothetical protein